MPNANHNSQTGGITGEVGYERGNSFINYSYNCGRVFGSNNIGNITGCNYGTITNNYFVNYSPNSPTGVNQGASVNCISVTSDTLKTYASVLGSNWKEDKYNLNNGFPLLEWEYPSVTLEQKIFS